MVCTSTRSLTYGALNSVDIAPSPSRTDILGSRIRDLTRDFERSRVNGRGHVTCANGNQQCRRGAVSHRSAAALIGL